MPSLYDYGAPARRQKARLESMFAAKAASENKKQPVDEGFYGPERGEPSPGAVHGKSYDQMTPMELNESAKSMYAGNIIERNMGSLAGLLGPLGAGLAFSALDRSLMNAALNNAGLANPGDYVDGKVAGGAGTSFSQSPEMMGRNDASRGGGGSPSVNIDLNTPEPSSPGHFHKGGKATGRSLFGPNPDGPDDGYVAFQIGERAVTPRQWKMLKPGSRADITAVFKKTGAHGYGR